MISRHERAAFNDASRGEENQPLLREEQQASMQQSGSAIEAKKESFWDGVPLLGGIVKLYDKYDATFLTMLGMQYFNQGTKVLVYLASADLFKAYYHLSPG